MQTTTTIEGSTKIAGTAFAKEIFLQIVLENCTRKGEALIVLGVSETKPILTFYQRKVPTV